MNVIQLNVILFNWTFSKRMHKWLLFRLLNCTAALQSLANDYKSLVLNLMVSVSPPQNPTAGAEGLRQAGQDHEPEGSHEEGPPRTGHPALHLLLLLPQCVPGKALSKAPCCLKDHVF